MLLFIHLPPTKCIGCYGLLFPKVFILARREHTFSYPEAPLLLVSTKKFQKIHPEARNWVSGELILS